MVPRYSQRMTKRTEKRAYKAPTLVGYGSITELTQSTGSGGDGTTGGPGGSTGLITVTAG